MSPRRHFDNKKRTLDLSNQIEKSSFRFLESVVEREFGLTTEINHKSPSSGWIVTILQVKGSVVLSLSSPSLSFP